MIRSMRTVLCRTLLGVLDDRRINVFSVAKSCRIPIADLKRLLEFGSPLSSEESERLVQWGTRMAIASKPKAGKINQASPKGEASPATAARASKPVTPAASATT